jgi:DEAD/DEAH box helicase domain-containing protein
VVDTTHEPRVIGETDFTSGPSTLHPKAIYIVEAKLFQVEKFDFDGRKAYVREIDCDYYTNAMSHTRVTILDTFERGSNVTAPAATAGAVGAGEGDGSREGELPPAMAADSWRSHGEVHVVSRVVGFKKIKFYTNENIGSGELQMPENEMHTTSYWLTLPRELMAALPYSGEERRDGVVALAYTLGQMAALFLMCDGHDIGVALGDNGQGEAVIARGLRTPKALAERPRPGDDYEPQIFIYDNYPGGIGLSEPLYRLHGRLVRESEALIDACACSDGCPSCVGPAGEMSSRGKEVALAILHAVRGEVVTARPEATPIAR